MKLRTVVAAGAISLFIVGSGAAHAQGSPSGTTSGPASTRFQEWALGKVFHRFDCQRTGRERGQCRRRRGTRRIQEWTGAAERITNGSKVISLRLLG
jgi:hypothetical protein